MEFVEVGKKEDVPEGQGKIVQVNGKDIALFNVGGEFYAVDNTCVHQGGPLGEGSLEGDIVTCPWHAWKYNVKTGVSPVNPMAKVTVYEVKVEEDKIKISTEPKQ